MRVGHEERGGDWGTEGTERARKAPNASVLPSKCGSPARLSLRAAPRASNGDGKTVFPQWAFGRTGLKRTW